MNTAIRKCQLQSESVNILYKPFNMEWMGNANIEQTGGEISNGSGNVAVEENGKNIKK